MLVSSVLLDHSLNELKSVKLEHDSQANLLLVYLLAISFYALSCRIRLDKLDIV